jgi:hypothetical protein
MTILHQQSADRGLALKRLAAGLIARDAAVHGIVPTDPAVTSGDDRGLRFTPAAPDEWFASIAPEMDPKIWLETGCVVADEAGALQLLPGLRQPRSPALVLATHREGAPFAILAAVRCQPSSALWLSTQDYVTRTVSILLLSRSISQGISSPSGNR